MKFSSETYLIVPLLEGFEWFDGSLQSSLHERGWPTLTRPESMVMIHIILGLTRPSDVARKLGLTRQTIHATLNNMITKGLVALEGDADDKRAKRIALTVQGEAMRKDAQHIAGLMFAELQARIGKSQVSALISALSEDWGPVPVFDKSGKKIA